MARPIDAVVGDLQSSDFNDRAKALAELVQRGREATAALLAVLQSGDRELRAQAARALAAIADPASADALAAVRDDTDERVRAYAAQGLARMRDPRALDALTGAIDDHADVLRPPFTPAVDELIAYGPPALPGIAPLLDAPGEMTRARAFLVLREVLSSRPEAADWTALARQLGSYDPSAAAPDRRNAARLWQEWIARHFPAS